jgi:DNA modification methylase
MYKVDEIKNTIICGNAVKELKKIPDNTFDLTVTSPPYDNLRSYNDIEWNFDIFKKIANELYRTTKKGGTIVWVVGDSVIKGSESGNSFRQALYFQELGFLIHDTMIYEKNSSAFPARRDGNRYTQIFEYMFVFSKDTKPKTANLLCDKENRWVGWKGFGKTTSRTNGDELKEYKKKEGTPEFSPRNNIWKYSTGKNYSTKDTIAFQQPAIFPEQLVYDHILTWSKEDDLVLDCFNGSGTTSKVSKILNRNFIGIELNKEYCEIAKERLKIPTIAIQKQPQVKDKRVFKEEKTKKTKDGNKKDEEFFLF